MGRQIQLLQSKKDVESFLDLCKDMQLNLFSYNGEKLSDKSKIQNFHIYFLSTNNHINNSRTERDTIEYSIPELYSMPKLTNIISNGRLWIDTDADETIIKKYNSLVRWIRKNYKRFYDGYWFAPDILEEVQNGNVIAAVNGGRLQLIDENLDVVLKDTWKQGRRCVAGGEWVDNTDIRYYEELDKYYEEYFKKNK